MDEIRPEIIEREDGGVYHKMIGCPMVCFECDRHARHLKEKDCKNFLQTLDGMFCQVKD